VKTIFKLSIKSNVSVQITNKMLSQNKKPTYLGRLFVLAGDLIEHNFVFGNAKCKLGLQARSKPLSACKDKADRNSFSKGKCILARSCSHSLYWEVLAFCFFVALPLA